jgi:hypothetical protein
MILWNKDSLSPSGDPDKLLRASTGKSVYADVPLGLGREKLFFDKS